MPPIVDDARRRGSVAVALLVALVSASCGGHVTAPTPPPDPISQVTPIDGNGPIRITFVSANVSPGTVVAGCGDLIEGCAGRLRLTFRLEPPSDGPALYTRDPSHRDQQADLEHARRHVHRPRRRIDGTGDRTAIR